MNKNIQKKFAVKKGRKGSGKSTFKKQFRGYKFSKQEKNISKHCPISRYCHVRPFDLGTFYPNKFRIFFAKRVLFTNKKSRMLPPKMIRNEASNEKVFLFKVNA
jgi:hypothetical protein